MSREVILKYLTEFNAWVEGQEVYVMFSNGGHRLVDSLEDFNEDVKYIVLKDSYFFYRKALAEGKTIQLNEAEKFADSNRGWVDLSCKSFGKSINLFPVNYYRIKPDEPKFKVGDFVRYVHSTPAKALEINNINGNRYYFTNSEMSCLEHELEPWTPVKGEWCWFYDNSDITYSHLAQFYDMHKSSANSVLTFMSRKWIAWNYCEPFLNSMPSYLKDK